MSIAEVVIKGRKENDSGCIEICGITSDTNETIPIRIRNANEWQSLGSSFSVPMIGMKEISYRVIGTRVEVFGSVKVRLEHINKTLFNLIGYIKPQDEFVISCYAKSDAGNTYIAHLKCGEKCSIVGIAPIEYGVDDRGEFVIQVNFSYTIKKDTKENKSWNNVVLNDGASGSIKYCIDGTRVYINGEVTLSASLLNGDSVSIGNIASDLPEAIVRVYPYTELPDQETNVSRLYIKNGEVKLEWCHKSSSDKNDTYYTDGMKLKFYFDYLLKSEVSKFVKLNTELSLYDAGGETTFPMIQIEDKRVYITGSLITDKLSYGDEGLNKYNLLSITRRVAPYEPINVVCYTSGKYVSVAEINDLGEVNLTEMKSLYGGADRTAGQWHYFCCSFPIV